MIRFRFVVGLLFCFFCAAPSSLLAQFGNEKKNAAALPANGIQLDQAKTNRWRMGVVITASRGPCVNMMATAAVPSAWPEQTVKLVKEEFSPEVKQVTFRELDSGVRQMVVDIPQLRTGSKATAVLTFEVTRSSSKPPKDTSIFSIPDRVPPAVGKFLAPSPMIESKDAKIIKLAKEITADKSGAWEKVEAMYDWVRANVEYQNGKLKGALAALRDKTGDCEEMTSLFIALCRASKIPARTVWIPDHCYPEFYLVDDKGVGHWFPCQAAGTRDFGGIEEFRPVLQKGDSFKVPEQKTPVRYVPEHVTGLPAGGGSPTYQFVRELLAAE